jgi:hypothetical protein
VPGIGNLTSATDAVRFNSSISARQPTVRMGLKPAGNASVATNGGAPGRAAGADSAIAPVREGPVQETRQTQSIWPTRKVWEDNLPVFCGQSGCPQVRFSSPAHRTYNDGPHGTRFHSSARE